MKNFPCTGQGYQHYETMYPLITWQTASCVVRSALHAAIYKDVMNSLLASSVHQEIISYFVYYILFHNILSIVTAA